MFNTEQPSIGTYKLQHIVVTLGELPQFASGESVWWRGLADPERLGGRMKRLVAVVALVLISAPPVIAGQDTSPDMQQAEQQVQQRLQEIKERLELTPEQIEKIRPLLTEEIQKLRALREKSRRGRTEPSDPIKDGPRASRGSECDRRAARRSSPKNRWKRWARFAKKGGRGFSSARAGIRALLCVCSRGVRLLRAALSWRALTVFPLRQLPSAA